MLPTFLFVMRDQSCNGLWLLPARFALALAIVGIVLAFARESQVSAAQNSRGPNVILLMTDDQGYGDLGCTGNPVLRTPHLDRLYRESVRLTNFHVDPTCSPTRAALMTGRNATRTGVWHTVMGRHMPRAAEQMMPQIFAQNGYATAIFGKWHLGDNFPFRPQDRGFQEVLVHGGGGVGQIPDFWGNDYFDDTYFHNGRPEKFTGYCTDVFFREAARFIESHRDQPFFVYLATNAPHSPYRVADQWSTPYKSQVGADAELATFYGMIANIDDNVGRLRERLSKLGLAENTLLIFLTDNGTARGATFTDYRGNDGRLVSGYNAGMRGRKGSPYEGGHRVPCFLHWPAGGLAGGRDVDGLAAHVDLLPTLIELCRLKPVSEIAYDGRSLRDALNGAAIPADRILFAHHQEVPDPRKYRFAAVMQGPWRLILRDDKEEIKPPAVELFHLVDDPGQQVNVAAKYPETTAKLLEAYEAWWSELAPGFDSPAEIVVGDDRQNPSQLTCFEWHGSQQWQQSAVRGGAVKNGIWAINVANAGEYEITLRRWPAEVDAPITAPLDGGQAIAADQARLRVGDFDGQKPVPAGAHSVAFTVSLPAGSTRLETWFTAANGPSHGAYYASVRRIDAR